MGVAVGVDGSLYIAATGNHRARKVDPQGQISTPSLLPNMTSPEGVAVAADGTSFFSRASRVLKVTPDGTTTVYAGGGEGADGGPAIGARFQGAHRMAMAADGTLFIAELDAHRVRAVSPAGIISTVAGNGTKGFSGDGGPATRAALNQPTDVAVAADGTLFITDRQNRQVRKVSPAGTISTYAGGGTGDPIGGGPATGVALQSLMGVAVSGDGVVYIADDRAHRVWTVSPAGILSVYADNGTAASAATAARPPAPRSISPTAWPWPPTAPCSSPTPTTSASAKWPSRTGPHPSR
ncbi:hypothetical protein AB0J52_27885 [Spirillospora sp. NPDC049652]